MRLNVQNKTHKKSCKGLLSVLLMLSIMLSLYVPFSLTANAAQDEQLAAVGGGGSHSHLRLPELYRRFENR